MQAEDEVGPNSTTLKEVAIVTLEEIPLAPREVLLHLLNALGRVLLRNMPLAQAPHEAHDAFLGRELGQREGGSIESGIPVLRDIRALLSNIIDRILRNSANVSFENVSRIREGLVGHHEILEGGLRDCLNGERRKDVCCRETVEVVGHQNRASSWLPPFAETYSKMDWRSAAFK